MARMAIPLPTPWSGQVDWTRPVLLAICGAFAPAAAGAVLAPAWFWLPLAIVAVAGDRRPGVPPHRRVLRRLAADRRRHAGDDAGRLVGPGAYQSTIAAVKAAELVLALLCVLRYGPQPGRVQPRPRVPGDVRRRAGAWAAPTSHRRTACARCWDRSRPSPSRSADCRPAGAGRWSAPRPGSRWSVGGRRGGARPGRPASGVRRQPAASGWRAWAIPPSSPGSASPRSMPA